MHRLDRASVPTPACLAHPHAGRGYSDLRGAEKEEIRQALLALQQNRCAYCERRTGAERDDGHIEHFRCQATHPDLQLCWANLFWSCSDEKSCGKHKDKCDRPSGSGPQGRFDPADLIDPASDDPDFYLNFLPDGTVRPREDLNAADRRRAEETIRVFHLAESPWLRKSREDAVRPYLNIADTLLSSDPGILRQFAMTELTRLDSRPFATAIKHFFRCFLS